MTGSPSQMTEYTFIREGKGQVCVWPTGPYPQSLSQFPWH